MTPEEEDLLQHVLGSPITFCSQLSPLLAAANAHPPIKAITYENPDQSGRDVLLEMERRFASRLSIMRTHIWLVEATAPGVDKGSGLLKLCEIMNIDPQRVLAIGDSENDIPMLQAAGFGVAMGNATKSLKAVADWIAPPIEEDGAAVALRRWVLGQDGVV